jgi:hypothetical protein
MTPARRPAPLQRFEELFVAVWCFVMPVTGTLLVPSIQGTIPAYMFGFGSLFFVFMRLQHGEMPVAVIKYFRAAGVVFLIWLFFLIASQLSLMLSVRTSFYGINVIDPNDSRILFRGSMFTQSLYLAACVLIALYFRYFFEDKWMKYVFYGGYLLAGYGIYEWLYFLIFHQPGDFLVNRTFGEIEHTASWSQGIDFGGLTLLRIKSTLGEPTFFAGVVLPYLFLALDHRKTVLSGMLLFTALFSTSTACYLGLAACLLVKSLWSGRIKVGYLVMLGVLAVFLAGIAFVFPDTFNYIFGDKFSGDNVSGKMRLDSATALHDLLLSFTLPNWIFGIGFGYVYLSVFFEVLIDMGLLGLVLFACFLLRPIIFLPIKPGSEGLKLGLLALAILFSLSLSELFLPPTWMFFGLAYRKLEQTRAPLASPFSLKLVNGRRAVTVQPS